MQPHERVTPAILADPPLHIVLVEPEIPPNTGNVARLCAATGAQLHLVQPLGFEITDRELKRAGLDYWEHLHVAVHDSLDAFLHDTAGRECWFFSTRAQQSYTAVHFTFGSMLVFGKETKGLPQRVIDANPERCLRIPQRPGSVRSINLSTAAGVAAYAALAQMQFPGMQ